MKLLNLFTIGALLLPGAVLAQSLSSPPQVPYDPTTKSFTVTGGTAPSSVDATGTSCFTVKSAGTTYHDFRCNGVMITSTIFFGGTVGAGPAIGSTGVAMGPASVTFSQAGSGSAADTGLVPTAAGVVKVSNGSTGFGAISPARVAFSILAAAPSAPATGFINLYALQGSGSCTIVAQTSTTSLTLGTVAGGGC